MSYNIIRCYAIVWKGLWSKTKKGKEKNNNGKVIFLIQECYEGLPDKITFEPKLEDKSEQAMEVAKNGLCEDGG